MLSENLRGQTSLNSLLTCSISREKMTLKCMAYPNFFWSTGECTAQLYRAWTPGSQLITCWSKRTERRPLKSLNVPKLEAAGSSTHLAILARSIASELRRTVLNRACAGTRSHDWSLAPAWPSHLPPSNALRGHHVYPVCRESSYLRWTRTPLGVASVCLQPVWNLKVS